MQLKGIALVPTSESVDERTLRDIILQIASLKPESLVFVMPSGRYFFDAVCLDYTTKIEIGGEEPISCDMAILDELNKVLPREGVPSIFLNPQRAAEYGLTYSFENYVTRFIDLLKRSIENFKIVTLFPAPLPEGELLETGRSIREAIEVGGHPSVLVVFTSIATDYSDYTKTLLDSLRIGDLSNLLFLHVPKSMENEYNTLLVGLGATDKLKTFSALFGKTSSETALLSFIAERVMKNENDNTDFMTKSILEIWKEHLVEERKALIAAETEVLKMIRASVKLFVTEGKVLDFDAYAKSEIEDETILERLKNQRTGVFIRILKDGRERGSMGTVTPITEDIAHEMINNSIEAAAYDQKYVPVEPEELDELSFEVYVLDPPESVYEEDELDPQKYGLIVEQGLKRGVVLPGIEKVESVSEQIALAKERAGIDEVIDAWEPVMMSRFSVEKF